MKRPSADCSHFESEANRFHGEHSASDVVTLISDAANQSAGVGVGRQRRVFLVDVNDWDFAPHDSLRGLGSDGRVVTCTSSGVTRELMPKEWRLLDLQESPLPTGLGTTSGSAEGQ